LNDLRYSAGGYQPVSPIGPEAQLRQAIEPEDGDKSQTFQFQLGTGF
jgi:outer membrane protein insertion porin family